METMEEERTVFDNIKRYCEERHFTIRALARAAKINQASLHKWAVSIPRADRLLRVAILLDVPMEALMEEVEIGDMDEKELYR